MMFDNDFPAVYRPDLDEKGYEKLPADPKVTGIEFLKMYTSGNPDAWGGSPEKPFSKEVIDKMSKPGTPPPADFFEEIKRQLGSTGVKQAASPSFEIDPDIDSPTVEKWIQEGNRKYGPIKTNPQEVERNIQLFRIRNSLIRGV